MPHSQPDSTLRFSDRVENYVRYRPGYPAEVIDVLARETGLTPASEIADVGSGTGISSELFLRNNNTVFGIEPNAEMREAAERLLAAYPRFHSVPARAEATALPNASIDYVTAGQAFHWFDPQLARMEFARILRPGGWAVLLWNARRLDSTPFLRDYDAMLERYGTDYRQVRHQNLDVARLRVLFDGAIGQAFQLRTLYNEQRFDFEGLRGRLLSSSYTPTANHPGYLPMLRELKRIFDEHAENGSVAIEYDTEIYFGHVAHARPFAE
ncbi:MAG TPA: class I SAM-dependent methyltransferase [Gemmatimonadaceae bacterium]|nr:class I SAM-dependent methyltransferase [Gemmatimonadaceae bacterium]